MTRDADIMKAPPPPLEMSTGGQRARREGADLMKAPLPSHFPRRTARIIDGPRRNDSETATAFRRVEAATKLEACRILPLAPPMVIRLAPLRTSCPLRPARVSPGRDKFSADREKRRRSRERGGAWPKSALFLLYLDQDRPEQNV